MEGLYLIAGLALRFPGVLDYEARQLAEVIPAADERDALLAACEALAALAPEAEGWEGHTVRATPLSVMAVAR